MRKDWTKIRKIRDGHSYWQRDDGEVGIADDSGTYPENCEPADNPPLLLDRARPVVVGSGGCMVPLKHENGRTSVTPATGFEALWVATQFNMRIEAHEKGGAMLVVHVIDADTFKANEGNLESLRAP